MAARLFLNGTEVITDSSAEISITKENPYITLSDSYTLDVSLPLDIEQNRRFFGNLQRIDTHKDYQEYTCRLDYNNTTLMEGIARIVQSTENSVKVQLACGVSALKMSSEQEGLYIDKLLTEGATGDLGYNNNLDYGPMSGENHSGYGIILHDNSNDKIMNLGSTDGLIGRGFPYISDCPKLLDVTRMVASKLGFDIDMSVLPEACEHIYIVSAAQRNMTKILPHWTVKEFLKEFQNFFGCTFIRSGQKALKLISLNRYAENPMVSIVPVSEYQADYSEEDDADGVINRNLEFDMEASDLETVEEDILQEASGTSEFTDSGTMENAFRNDSDAMRRIYNCNGEIHVGWELEDGTKELKRIAPFNPLKRFPGADSVKLKIVPAYMEEIETSIADVYNFGPSFLMLKLTLTIPSVSNPFEPRNTFASAGSSTDESATLQELVEGTETVIKEEDKPDRINVVFLDGREESVTCRNEGETREQQFQVHLSFTDYSFKRQLSNNRSKWSFSLNELTGYEFHLGQLHRLNYRCSHKVKNVFKFVSESDTIPDPTNIFIINGKKFACEKIEGKIRDGRLDRLMTGYFYEFTD